MKYKRLFFKTFFISVGVALFIVSLPLIKVTIHDPLQFIHHKSYDIDKFKKNKNMRLQARGIIDNFSFDSIILGTSMLENSSSLEASKYLGGKFINLSISASHFYERAFILDYLLQRKTIKHIIYSFDNSCLNPNESTAQLDRWELLYDNIFLNDLYVLYDKKYIKMAYKNKNENVSTAKYVSSIAYFDKPTEWMSSEYESCSFGGLQNWVSNLEKQGFATFLLKTLKDDIKKIDSLQKVEAQMVDISESKKYIDKYLLSFVENYPQTQFYIIFPPYYRYRYAKWAQASEVNVYFLHQEVIKFMVSKTEQYKNLHIYGFEDQPFVDDIKNYKDTGHYHSDINSYMTRSLSREEHKLTLKNINEYLSRCEKMALEFDIKKLYDDSQAMLRKHNKPITWEEYKLKQLDSE